VSNPSLERLIVEALQHGVQSGAPDVRVAEMIAAARSVRRRPRWLALLLERPMGRPPTVLVGSPGMRTAALALALVLATVVGTLALVAGGIVTRRDLSVVTPSQTIDATPAPLSVPPSPSHVPARAGLVAYSLVRQPAPGATPCIRQVLRSCTIVDAWIANADGSNARPLFPDAQSGGWVIQWSADGSRLLHAGGPIGLAVADPSGTILQAIDGLCPVAGKDAPIDRTRCTGADMPALSPDGRRIAFVRSYANDDGATVVAILDLERGTVSELAATRATGPLEKCMQDPGPACQGMNDAPTWSPDGTLVAFGRQHMAPDAQGMWASGAIYTIGADGSDLRRVTPTGMFGITPAWSPDGTTLAFTNVVMIVNKSGTAVTDMRDDIWTVHPDGSGLGRRTNDGLSANPGWTIDGRVTFVRDGVSWVMDPDGAGQTRLGFDLPTLSEAGCLSCLYPGSDHVALWQPGR
jgi:hypothetical protein